MTVIYALACVVGGGSPAGHGTELWVKQKCPKVLLSKKDSL